jgi:hypothetical protein
MAELVQVAWPETSAAFVSETEAAIAKITGFVGFYEAQSPAWRSLIDGILRNRLVARPRELDR